ncbi:MAG: stage III sporulation protein AD [Clostridia bacterium]|nr:stage III sporulation protein AD [Clostridia bacterium]
MEIFGYFALAVTAAFCAVALKKYAPETSVIIAVAASAALLVNILSGVSPVINEINELVSVSGISTGYVPVLMKTIGICFVCQFTADACRDAGQNSLASKTELAARVAVIIISLPLFRDILNTVSGILKI